MLPKYFFLEPPLCKGKVISSQKIQLYAYNNISYKTVPITIFRLMGNNVNFVKWQWNHFVIGSRRIVSRL